MSTPYSGGGPLQIKASTAVKLGFFAALGATLFSLVLSILAGVVVVVLAILGFSFAGYLPFSR